MTPAHDIVHGRLQVLIVGSGGREHALAWSCARSPRVERVLMAPGNAGWPSADCIDVAVTDVPGILSLCERERIDLVVVGPEVAIEAGLTDALAAAGIRTFGPSRAAAELEWSKSHARRFCERHALPSPANASFAQGDADAAEDWARAFDRPVVVKLDGLAAGKGVIVPSDGDETVAAIRELSARGRIVLEQRLQGEEVTLLAFSDGRTVRTMPPAQDHKRIGEGDTGPNTGGMGAYAPAPICPPALVEEITAKILQPTIDALAAEGTPYVGVLYAGLMLTGAGPMLIEFNCRFGDPETQVILPLLETDLVEIVLACIEGSLASLDIAWKGGTACTVALAAHGYPGTPRTGDVISLPASLSSPATTAPSGDNNSDNSDNSDDSDSGRMVFHAGTVRDGNGRLLTAGGRVLAVTGLGADLAAARTAAYALASEIHFDGMQLRRDIGWRALARQSGGYQGSGVDIDAGNEAVSLLKASVERTHTPNVLAGVGAFGGAFDASALKSFDHPVLVASTDGVGTKVMLAAQTGRYDVAGQDIVNHCVNDVLVQRAEPLFFLDYVASSRLIPAHVASVVAGMAKACSENGCVLLGGETAEMPGVYADGHFDVAGTLVGVCERDRMLPRSSAIRTGDLLIGIASNGPHTNGYSLLRKVFAGLPLDAAPEPLGEPLADAMLRPHRSYLPVLRALLDTDLVKALVHITGGGLPENLPRALPPGCSAHIRLGAWPVPPLFRLVRDVSGLGPHELHRTLNMGIGMVVVCAPDDVPAVQALIDEETWVIGELRAGRQQVVLT